MDPFSEETHPIIQLIINNDLDNLKTLVKVEDINICYPCKELKGYGYISPLIAALRFHKIDICAFLLTKGADPDLTGNGRTPLYYACQSAAPVDFVRRLIKAGAKTKQLVDFRTKLTPLQTAAINDRPDVMKVLIDAGELTTPLPNTHPQHHNYNKKISALLDVLVSSKGEMYYTTKLLFDVQMAVSQKREVLETVGSRMLEKNPLNHLTAIDILLFTTTRRDKYHHKCIEWLKDNNKLNFYVENVVKRFPKIIYHFPDTAIGVLRIIFSTMEEIPSETSLALIPQLLGFLSSRKINDRKNVLSTLYVITRNTNVNNGWNQDFINKLCTAIVPSVAIKHLGVRMYAYAILANLLPLVHTSNLLTYFISMGIDVPEDVITSAEIMREEDMKDRLIQLQKHLSKPTSEIETTNTEPSNKTREWHRISKRWSQQLENLADTHEVDKVVKVGNVVIGKDDEFRIAGGSDGTEVFLGLRDDGTEVAVKRMTKFNYEVLNNEKDFLRLPELDDNSIVRYVDFIEDETFGYLVLQLCECSLEEYIKRGIEFPGGRLCGQVIVNQVLTSLKILHQQNPPILHRDIKPQNVLIDVTRKARLSDFGISRRLPCGQTTYSTRSAGTKYWMAKETINEDDDDEHVPYKISADIQVAGMLLYYILSGGHHPFGKGARCETNILDGKYNLDHVLDVVAKDLIERMINRDPKKRPTVEECLDHPYFWIKQMRIDFLQKVANEKEIDKHYDNPDHQNLMVVWNQCAEEGQFSTWKDTMKDKLPQEVFKEMERRRKKFPYHDDGFGLMRFIRNLHQHHAEAAADIDLMEMFPGLIVSVYKFTLIKEWNKRPTLEDFYSTKSTNLKDSDGSSSLDGALSKLSL